MEVLGSCSLDEGLRTRCLLHFCIWPFQVMLSRNRNNTDLRRLGMAHRNRAQIICPVCHATDPVLELMGHTTNTGRGWIQNLRCRCTADTRHIGSSTLSGHLRVLAYLKGSSFEDYRPLQPTFLLASSKVFPSAR
jgi:hypothetical protein